MREPARMVGGSIKALAGMGLIVFAFGCSIADGLATRDCQDAGSQIELSYGGVVQSPSAEARLAAAVSRIACVVPEIRTSCHCCLLNSAQRNALSLSDGRIFVTAALYDELDDRELLALVAHEMAHIAARDGKAAAADPKSQLAREIRADLRAREFLERAGEKPDALVTLLAALDREQPQGWSDIRIRALAENSKLSR